MKTKILIVDDHSFTRAGIKAIIETVKSNEVVGEAVDGNDAIIKVREKQPDIVIMDINMPGITGIEATLKILSEHNTLKIMALSMHSGEQFVKEMLKAGAVAYLLKDDVPEELLRAIEKVSNGEMFLSSAVTKTALSNNVATSYPNIMETKLRRPPVLPDHITRKKIIDKLENNVTNPLSIISAGAGYGKSVAIGEWLEKTTYLNTWLSLDEEHNDFRTLVSYLIASIEKIFEGAMKDTRGLLISDNLPPFNIIFTSFTNELCNIDQDFILVLDDFQRLTETKIYQFFNEWFRFPPPNVHLSIIARYDPHLNINSLRNSGRMIEIRMKDLSFSNKEIADFFKISLGIQLKESTLELLQDKTEGWVIGLRLISMALKKEEDIYKELKTIDGGMNAISEYLIAEVLSKQPNNILDYILESSVLNRFCSELIEEITLDKNKIGLRDLRGEELIQWLVKSNMFLVPLDSKQKWYRYHHLFQKLLQNELIKRRTTNQVDEIHSLASEWFKKNNFIDEAIEHSIKAKKLDRTIGIIEESWEDAFDKDHWTQVKGWIALLPEEGVVQSTNLLLAQVWISQKSHSIKEIPALIALVEHKKSKLSNKEAGYLSFAKSMVHLFTGNIKGALVYAEEALQLIPKSHYIFRADTYGWWTVAMHVNGRGEEAIESANEAIKNIDPPGEPVQLARRTMHPNFIYMFNADLSSVKRSLDIFFTFPSNSSYMLAFGSYFQASVSWWSNNLEDAIKGFEQVISYKYQCRPRIVIEAYICTAMALQELNRPIEANKAMHRGSQFAEFTEDPVNKNIIASGQIRLKLLQGELGTAKKWLKNTKHSKLDVSMLWWIEVSAITRCRVLLAINTTKSLLEALELLEVYKVYAESIFNKLRTIEIIILQARAYLKLKRKSDAIKALEHVWLLNSNGELIRPFIEGSADLKDLLWELKQQGIMVDFIDLIQSKVKNSPEVSIQDQDKRGQKQVNKKHQEQYTAFTRKEIEILHCVSEGLRNSEIADKLYNSEQTIKKHLSNMFQKIQVRNRINLISKAKKLGMLE